jgi:hypothetical protein
MSRHRQIGPACLKRAKTGLMRRSKPHLYSINSSARTSNEGGTVILGFRRMPLSPNSGLDAVAELAGGDLQDRAEQQSF